MQVELYFHEITNDHGGYYCSDAECEEESQGSKTAVKWVVYKRLKKIFAESLDELNHFEVEDFLVEGPLFDYLKKKYEKSQDTGTRGSGYCENKSNRFEKHTCNLILKAVRIAEIIYKNPYHPCISDSDSSE